MSQEITRPAFLHDVGRVADQAAATHLLQEYQAQLTAETRRRQRTDLASFTAYLAAIPVQVPLPLYDHLAAWRGITWGIVEGFKQWQLQQGFSIGTINVRLATIRAYCGLAAKAAVIDEPTYRLIAGVKSIARRAGRNIDEGRQEAGKMTRRSTKKAEALVASAGHVQALKAQLREDTSYLGRRDLLLVCLLVVSRPVY